MKKFIKLISFTILVFNLHSIAIVEAKNLNQEFIDTITEEINNAESSEKRAEYLVYRARRYARTNKLEMALSDFSSALKNDNKDWILLERCKLLIEMERYSDVKKDSSDLLTRNYDPSGETSYYYYISTKELKKKSLDEMPILILMPPINLDHKTNSNSSHSYCHAALDKMRLEAERLKNEGLNSTSIDDFLKPYGTLNPFAGLVEGRIIKKYASFSTTSPFPDFSNKCINEVFNNKCSEYTIKNQRKRMEHRRERNLGHGTNEWLELRGRCVPYEK